MSAHQQLRAATAADHEQVDAVFARFDLADRQGYVGFLAAHARAVPAIEAALADVAGPPQLRPRTPLLLADLAAFGLPPPDAAGIARPASAAAAWGMAYVLEGSRLGGGMLARNVAPDLPRAYLTDVHLPGEWRAFGQGMDAALVHAADLDEAAAAAHRVFTVYAWAAAID